MLSIYLLPFLILKTPKLSEIKFFFKKLNKFNYFNIFFYFNFRFKFFQLFRWRSNQKILLLFIKNQIIINILISIIGSITIIYIFSCFDKKQNILFLLILTFVNTDIIFNEYFDPIYFIFGCKFNYKKINRIIIEKFIYFIVIYFSLFLIGANLLFIICNQKI